MSAIIHHYVTIQHHISFDTMYMYVCVYVCMCVCMYVCMYVCMHVYIYIYIYMYTHTPVCYMCVYMHTYICIYIHQLYIYTYIYIYMYIYIYIYTHAYTHIHMYAYTLYLLIDWFIREWHLFKRPCSLHISNRQVEYIMWWDRFPTFVSSGDCVWMSACQSNNNDLIGRSCQKTSHRVIVVSRRLQSVSIISIFEFSIWESQIRTN